MPKNVLTDSVIELTDIITRQKYPERLRLVKYRDESQDREFVFLTNAFHLTSLEIAELYKNRWQVELFFYEKHIIMQSCRQSRIDIQQNIHTTSRFNFA